MSSAKDQFDCLVVTPDKVLYEDVAVRLSVPTVYGEVLILPYHTPIYMKLTEGQVSVNDGREEHKFKIEGGILRFRDNHATVIVGFEV